MSLICSANFFIGVTPTLTRQYISQGMAGKTAYFLLMKQNALFIYNASADTTSFVFPITSSRSQS